MMFKEIATDRHNLDMSIQRNKPNYIYRDRLSNLEQKLLFSWKLGILQFKSRYKRLYNNQRCILKPCGGIDSLHHLIYECEYLNTWMWRDRSTTEMKMKWESSWSGFMRSEQTWVCRSYFCEIQNYDLNNSQKFIHPISISKMM